MSTLSRPSQGTAEERSVLLTAVADTAFTEIRLFDGLFREKARATGRLEVSVRPGLYKVVFVAGDGYEERFVVIEDDADAEHVPGPPVSFSSASPLRNTAAFRQEHADFIQSAEREQTAGMVGRDSAAVIFVRAVPRDGTVWQLPDDLELSIDGRVLPNTTALDQDPTIRRWVESPLAPGPHTVTVTVGDTRDSRTVFTPRQLRTRVTILLAPLFQGSGAGRWQIGDVSVHYQQRPFDPSDSILRLVEIGRQRLATGRSFASPIQLVSLWPNEADLQDAMLLLIGAHLQPTHAAHSQAARQWCLSVLNSTMPDHPDVVALRLAARADEQSHNEDADPLARILHLAAVPSLAASWPPVVARSAEDPLVVPAGSAAAITAPHLRIAYGWLHWKTSGLAEPVEHQFVDLGSVDLEQLLRDLAVLVFRGVKVLAAAAKDPAVAEEHLLRAREDGNLTQNEMLLARFAVWAAFTSTTLSKTELAEWDTPLALRRRLVSSMSLPLVTIGSIVVPLREKLRRRKRASGRIADQDRAAAAHVPDPTSRAPEETGSEYEQGVGSTHRTGETRERSGNDVAEIASAGNTEPRPAEEEELEKLRNEVADLRRQLENRKAIERAKAILMRRTGLSEQEAYRTLQRTSQDRQIPMVDVAREVAESEEK